MKSSGCFTLLFFFSLPGGDQARCLRHGTGDRHGWRWSSSFVSDSPGIAGNSSSWSSHGAGDRSSWMRSSSLVSERPMLSGNSGSHKFHHCVLQDAVLNTRNGDISGHHPTRSWGFFIISSFSLAISVSMKNRGLVTIGIKSFHGYLPYKLHKAHYLPKPSSDSCGCKNTCNDTYKSRQTCCC